MVRIENLTKNYKTVQAVNNLSFHVEAGEIFAFLGPNGAGKTTTLRMMLDIIRPDSGKITWNFGQGAGHLPPAAQIGYLPEERGLYLDLPVLRTLVYLASIRGMKPAEARTESIRWLEKMNLADRAGEKLQTLSKGNQQKVQFIASILHRPRFAILDEPFSGLDPVNQEIFMDLIRTLRDEGMTILLSAHQMNLVEKIADRLLMINLGESIFCGTIRELMGQHAAPEKIILSFEPGFDLQKLQLLPQLERTVTRDDGQMEVYFGDGIQLNGILGHLSTLNGITGIYNEKTGLHEIFLKMVKQ